MKICGLRKIIEIKLSDYSEPTRQWAVNRGAWKSSHSLFSFIAAFILAAEFENKGGKIRNRPTFKERKIFYITKRPEKNGIENKKEFSSRIENMHEMINGSQSEGGFFPSKLHS